MILGEVVNFELVFVICEVVMDGLVNIFGEEFMVYYFDVKVILNWCCDIEVWF